MKRIAARAGEAAEAEPEIQDRDKISEEPPAAHAEVRKALDGEIDGDQSRQDHRAEEDPIGTLRAELLLQKGGSQGRPQADDKGHDEIRDQIAPPPRSGPIRWLARRVGHEFLRGRLVGTCRDLGRLRHGAALE